MSLIDRLARFVRDEDGGVAVIVSLLLTVLIGFVALGVDVASLYRDRARLQAVGDLTAISAMARPDAALTRAGVALSRNGAGADALDTLQTGRFLRNPAIPARDRFAALPAGGAGVNAVRVVLIDNGALHFSRVFTQDTHVALNRTALATRTGGASFSLDSHIASLNGGDLNAALTQRYGVTASVNTPVLSALADVSINIDTLLDAIDRVSGTGGRNPAEVLNITTTVGTLIAALQSQLPPALASALGGLANAGGSTGFEVAALVGGIDTQLGLTVTDFLAGIDISALDVIHALIASDTAGAALELTTDVTVPGVLGVAASMTAGEPPANSGWIALGEEGVQLHRAAVRIGTDMRVQPDLLGNLGVGISVTDIRLPIYTELAGAAASLEQIDCAITAPDGIAARFSTASTALHPGNGTSVAALYLGHVPSGATVINPADVAFADILSVNIVIDLPLLPDLRISGLTVQARSHARVGTSQSDEVAFTHTDVAQGVTRKTFGSGALLSSAVRDLLSPANTEFRVKPGQGGLVSGLAAPVVATLLATLPERLLSGLLTPVDSVIDAALDTAGVEVGAGALTLTGHHCEPIRLVR